MNKKYILSRNDEFVCEDITLESATQICTHFNHPHDHFKLENADGDSFYFDRERKEFHKLTEA